MANKTRQLLLALWLSNCKAI